MVSAVHRPSVGLSISLTGRYAGHGLQVLQAAQLWAERSGVEIVHYDDGSRIGRAAENAERLLEHDRVRILLGPYSSSLAREVTAVAEAHGRVLWNHGGSSDEIAGPHVVSTPTPASRYFAALPSWLQRAVPDIRTITILSSGRGSFAPHVARGLAGEAAAMGYAVEHVDLARQPPPGAEVLVLAGSFEEEVEVMRSRPEARVIAAVAAGVSGFHEALGALADGVVGPSQWEPDPHSDWFARTFEERFGRQPDYPAAGAFAMGLVIDECIRRAGSLHDHRLREVAVDLDVETFYGRFRIDAQTGRQIGHRMLLVQWAHGRTRVIGGGRPAARQA